MAARSAGCSYALALIPVYLGAASIDNDVPQLLRRWSLFRLDRPTKRAARYDARGRETTVDEAQTAPPEPEVDAAVDEAEEESFPSSDPQSSWAGPDTPAEGGEDADPS